MACGPGLPDPTKAPVVRKMLRGIQELHPAAEKRAKPLQLEALEQTVAYWTSSANWPASRRVLATCCAIHGTRPCC
jgi:hypothetical protein